MLKPLLYRSTLLLDQALTHLPPFGRFRPLTGSFSAWKLLQNGNLTGGVITSAQEPGPCPTGSITDLASMSQHDHQPWPVFWVRSDDARLVGRMLHWRDTQDRLCAEGVFHTLFRRQIREDKFFRQILVSPPTILPGAWMSIASNWANGYSYFHWLLDGLTRLQLREHLPEETRILIPASTSPFISQTLDMLGISGISSTAPGPSIQPERYYFCSPTSMTGVWNPLGFEWLREKFASFRSPDATGKPIFLTRRGKARIPSNLTQIEAVFSTHGFEIVDCGILPVREQIRLASAAPAIAGLHGGAMTNLLWAKCGTPALEIFQSSYLNACYEQIAFQGCLNYTGLVLDPVNPLIGIASWLQDL